MTPYTNFPTADGIRPLCVDMDGTLVRTDTALESLISIIVHREELGGRLKLLAAGRAVLEKHIAVPSHLAIETLPYNAELIEFLRGQKQRGRRIVLTTAGDCAIAKAISEYLGFFDDIISIPLRAKETIAAELVRRYGRKGFDYAGDSRADLPIWREAHDIIIVNCSPSVVQQARKIGNVVAELDARRPVFPATIRAMRPHQWVKNLLVFVPILASQSLGDWPGLLATFGIFASFCVTASGVYLINDLLDLATDRRHPRKRNRPLASGALSLQIGATLAVMLLAIGFALAVFVGGARSLLIYTGITFAYSIVLKTYPLVDVFTLAALYTLRIIAGGASSGHQVTLWLLGFSGFTFLGLALVKRAGELMVISQSSSEPAGTRRGYRLDDARIIPMFGISSAFASSVVLALYVNSSAAALQYESPEVLYGLVPLMLFWQLRLWLSTERGNMHDDPIVYSFRDWVSWMVAASAAAIILLASLGARIV
jgi:4-hydroxybenzoate polyprenyltransferase/phosphoserine phosphatase